MMEAAAGPLVLARHDLSRDRPDLALEALARATGPELETHEFWSLRASALYRLRDWDAAIDAARTGLERKPGDLVLLDVLALAQLERGRRRDARSTIDAALELYPDRAILHAHRALILARSARRSIRFESFKEARRAVDEALRLDPHSEAALRVRAQVATLSGDRHAPAYGAELLSLDPDDEQAHVIAGAAFARRGDVAAGLDHYVEAARLNPANPRMAWIGRRSRVLQGPFAAPLRFASRLSRGNLRFAWIAVVVVSVRSHQPILIAAVLVFWAYMWAVQIYLRVRVGKAPK